jgi:UDP-N-acetylmuramate: L-alanyl-gamma-D-glutamyl-meso-diaminopimelate ligase
MGGVAVIAQQAGHRVTGCDAHVYPPMSTQLRDQGIELFEGWDPAQASLNPDLFVVGNVVSRGNPLMEEILDRGQAYVSGPQWLAEEVLRDKWVLAVAGTHGKTTTSSMLAWILDQAGLDPGFLIGGVPENFRVSARLSDSRFFVIEADEYDTAFFDKRSKFVHYRPRTAVLNNLEYDHADIFPDLTAIETQFHHLVRTVPRSGLIIANGRESSLARVMARGCWSAAEWTGTPEGWRAGAADDQGGFDIHFNGTTQGRVEWTLLGEHNRMNSVAAVAAARHAGVMPAVATEALGKFCNVKRRMEVKGIVNGITLYDDFAHHPTAIATTIAGLREKVARQRIVAVLEPRSNTMKSGVMKDALAPSLTGADEVFCYSQGLEWDAAQVLAPLGQRSHCFDDLDGLVRAVAHTAKAGDHVLVMSNGGFGGIHDQLLAAFAAPSAEPGLAGRETGR